MKLENALRIISKPVDVGYRVIFEHKDGIILRSDYFPARDEEPFDSESSAWAHAHAFAGRTSGQCVNFYVVHADTWMPVAGYRERMIKNRG